MRVLVLCASGNTTGHTYSAADSFLQECIDRGHDAKLIDLYGIDMKDCNGCRSCHETGRCVMDDGTDALFSEMEGIDLLVLATPLRFNGVSSVMKKYIDRLNPYWFTHRDHPTGVCGIICAGSQKPVFGHALSELKSAAMTLKSDWKGELLIGDTDRNAVDALAVKQFVLTMLNSR